MLPTDILHQKFELLVLYLSISTLCKLIRNTAYISEVNIVAFTQLHLSDNCSQLLIFLVVQPSCRGRKNYLQMGMILNVCDTLNGEVFPYWVENILLLLKLNKR